MNVLARFIPDRLSQWTGWGKPKGLKSAQPHRVTAAGELWNKSVTARPFVIVRPPRVEQNVGAQLWLLGDFPQVRTALLRPEAPAQSRLVLEGGLQVEELGETGILAGGWLTYHGKFQRSYLPGSMGQSARSDIDEKKPALQFHLLAANALLQHIEAAQMEFDPLVGSVHLHHGHPPYPLYTVDSAATAFTLLFIQQGPLKQPRPDVREAPVNHMISAAEYRDGIGPFGVMTHTTRGAAHVWSPGVRLSG